MSKWREIYGKKHTTNNESDNNINVKDDYIKTESAYIKNEGQEEYNSQQPEKENKSIDNEINKDSKSNVNTETINAIVLEADIETTNARTYYPTTTDKAWKLAENLLTNKGTTNKKLLLTIAKKYKDTPNADFIRFYNDNGTLFIENVPSPKIDFNYGDIVQTSYFVRDFKTGNIHFPKTTDEAWNLVKKLLPKDLVKKAQMQHTT